jgi:hypothetical protein
MQVVSNKFNKKEVWVGDLHCQYFDATETMDHLFITFPDTKEI